MLWLLVSSYGFQVVKDVEFPGLRYVRVAYDPESPFSLEELLRDPDSDIIDACPQCGPCPVGCEGNSSVDCNLSHAYQDCWAGSCIIVCVYSCSACGERGEYGTIPNSTGNCSSSLSVQERSKSGNYTGPVVIFDMAGRIVWRGTWRGRAPSLPKGIYVVKAPRGDFTKRIIVR